MTPPTVRIVGLFTTIMIDAYEGIEVSTFDFPGAYLHADVSKDKNILLKYRGAFAEIMCWINPYHKKNAS